jgi:hypothetical protein
MRKLKVKWADFEATIGGSDEWSYYLDRETGEVLTVMPETRERLEELLDAAGPDASIEEILEDATAADWEKEALCEAWRVEEQLGTRVVSLRDLDLRETHADLEDFVAIVNDAAVRVELERAIHGSGAFRRFRDAIAGCFRERKQWFTFRDERRRQRAAKWFSRDGIEVEWLLPQPPADALPRPTPRQHLLEGVLKFTRTAARLAGVKRIALVGSLTREQPDPKDADMLVTVSDDMDLATLAKAGRQLAGHAQQQGRGADVFLANERGEYIGRTCHWRDCGPGIRASCDAQHCGRRHFLHDDFKSIWLRAGDIAGPPIVLWPALHARVSAPPDVEAILLGPLHQAAESKNPPLPKPAD